MIVRAPRPELQPYFQRLWAMDGGSAHVRSSMERVLPTGLAHVAIRLTDRPLCVYQDVGDRQSHSFGLSVVGGPRTGAYLRDVSVPSRSVGAQLRPVACGLLFALPASALTNTHVALDDLWGASVAEMRTRLLEADTLQRQLDLFESMLVERILQVGRVHPAVRLALQRFRTTADVGSVVRESGYSHRQFISLFRDAVGLNPKAYCRVLRFRRALERLCARPDTGYSLLALEAGYSDQAHFSREFREFAGLSPGDYRKAAPSQPLHVPVQTASAGRIAEVKFLQDHLDT